MTWESRPVHPVAPVIEVDEFLVALSASGAVCLAGFLQKLGVS